MSWFNFVRLKSITAISALAISGLVRTCPDLREANRLDANTS